MATDQTINAADDEDIAPVRRFSGRQIFGGVAAATLVGGTVIGGHWLLSGASDKDASRRPQPASIGLPFAEPSKPAPTPSVQPAAVSPPPLPALPVERVMPQTARQADPGMISHIAAVSAPVTARRGSTDQNGGGAAEGSEGEGTHDALSKSLVPSDVGKTTSAELLKDADYTVPAGTLIRCVLDTAIN